MKKRLLVRTAWIWVLFGGGMMLIAAVVSVSYLIHFIMENWGPDMARIFSGPGLIIGGLVFLWFTLWSFDTLQDDQISRQAERIMSRQAERFTEKKGKRKQ